MATGRWTRLQRPAPTRQQRWLVTAVLGGAFVGWRTEAKKNGSACRSGRGWIVIVLEARHEAEK
jgi:hypothetical protein